MCEQFGVLRGLDSELDGGWKGQKAPQFVQLKLTVVSRLWGTALRTHWAVHQRRDDL